MKLDFIGNGNVTQLGQQLLETNLNLAGSAIDSSRDIVDRGLDLNRDALLAGLGFVADARKQGEQLQGTLTQQGSSAESGLKDLIEQGTQLFKTQLQDLSSAIEAQRAKLGSNDIRSLDESIRAVQDMGYKLLSLHGKLINLPRGSRGETHPAPAKKAPAAKAAA
ncbi:MAG: hypothetical protein HWE39_03280 [Oceanospirillaceae bacterium]|nr:hypothetical protein [Oceanospirillaceae bacterium]